MKVKHEGSADRRPAVLDLLSRLLVAWLALALVATGCAGARPLKGGRASTKRQPAGVVEQALVQGENAAQAIRQDQESVQVRTYTVPAGSRFEQSQAPGTESSQTTLPASATVTEQPSTLNPQPLTSFFLSAPMPVVERVEARTRTELGAAQKDTARELGARLSSLKGIVWVGTGLFASGLVSLVWPPLRSLSPV